jgi:glutamate N-acetyltransferase/amino-acid N-acetyltransferase
LVKTALFASDPNWGRILAAVGRAGLEDLDIDSVKIYLGETQIVAAGARAPGYREELGQLEMNQEEIAIRIDLARGSHNERVWTSDLSHDYVRINAEYRT